MRLKTVLAATIVAFFLSACATRNTPCEVLEGNGNVAQMSMPNQATSKWDALTGAAIADSDGDARNSNQRVAVDVQAPNQATGAQLTVQSLMGQQKAAAGILTSTSPGEAAVVRRLDALEQSSAAIQSRLDTDPALTDDEASELKERLMLNDSKSDALIAKLDDYSAKKLEAARVLVPDLSALKTIIYNITQNTAAGAETPNISDAQGESIARVAESAVTTSATESE